MESYRKLNPLEVHRLHKSQASYNEIILVKNGDFYETFGDDAIVLSRILGHALTKMDSVMMGCFPASQIDAVLRKVKEQGCRVSAV